MIVSLTGFMGSGKSSVGRRLASLLPGFRFVDLDEFIEAHEGRSIPSIFEEDGERKFRSIEHCCLMEVLSCTDDIVLSLGGGTVMNSDCEKAVHCGTLCFYLKHSPESLKRHLSESDSRPMLGNDLGRVDGLMELRAPVYERVSHRTVECDGKYPMEVAREIRLSILGVNNSGKK